MFDFKEILNAFKEDSLMSSILEQFSSMISDAKGMFETIGKSIVEGKDPEKYHQEIYDRDIRLNKAERQIRKKIIEHLALNPGNDLGTCLVLFSAVKDAERLGDYCKNLQEVSEFLKGKNYPEKWVKIIESLHGRICHLFELLSQSYVDANETMAHQVVDEVKEIGKECDRIVEDLIADQSEQNVSGAVATSLTVRYFKRTAAHIGNIASGLINPVHKIDFNE